MHGQGALSINFNNIFQSEDRYVIDHYQNLNLYTYFHFYTREAKISFSYRFGSSNGLKLRKEKGLTEEQNRAAY